jgi:integrase
MVVKSEITKKNYEGSLRRMREAMKVEGEANEWLGDHAKVCAWIDGLTLSASSKKAYYVAVKATLRDANKFPEAQKVYDEKFKALAEGIYTESKKQLTTPTEAEKTLTWAEILAVKDKIEPKPDTTSWTEIQDWVIYSLYTLLPPLRADYSPMMVFDKKPKEDNGNYMIMRKSKPVIVLNHYKTQATFGRVEIAIPTELMEILKVWLTFNPSEWLLLKDDGQPMTSDGLSQRVIRIFEKHTGKSTGISMLRHAYITMRRSGKELSLLEKEKLAHQMLHSTLTNELYRRIDAE